ncbi:MAG: LysR substrate-binding domain-containing protein [Alistipes onderdonkii]
MLREGGSGTLEVIKTALGKAGIRIPELNVVMRLGSTEGIKAFVRNSDAMAILSVISVVDELRSGTLRIVDVDSPGAHARLRVRASRGRTCPACPAVRRFRPGRPLTRRASRSRFRILFPHPVPVSIFGHRCAAAVCVITYGYVG